MSEEPRLEKFQEYCETVSGFSPRITDVYNHVCSRADDVTKEDVTYLLNMVYKEGFLDGANLFNDIYKQIL